MSKTEFIIEIIGRIQHLEKKKTFFKLIDKQNWIYYWNYC